MAVGECDCGECQTAYLDSAAPQNPKLRGSRGYIGRIEIRAAEDFGITVTLDQIDGKLYELYALALDLRPPFNRQLPERWTEKGRTITPM